MIVSDDDKLEVKEESRRGLTFPEVKVLANESLSLEDLERSVLPAFETLPPFLLQHALSPPTGLTSVRPFGSFTQTSFLNVIVFIRRLLIFTAHSQAERSVLNRSFDDEDVTVVDLETRQSLKSWMESNATLLPPYIELLDLAFSSQRTGIFRKR